jgi:hypothetical protein
MLVCEKILLSSCNRRNHVVAHLIDRRQRPVI